MKRKPPLFARRIRTYKLRTDNLYFEERLEEWELSPTLLFGIKVEKELRLAYVLLAFACGYLA